MSKLENIKASFSTLSLVYILLGLVLLIFPAVSTKIFCVILGIAALCMGVMRLVSYFRSNSDAVFLRTGFISGFLLCAVGLFFVIKPTLVASVLPFIIGLLICFNGLIKLQSAFELQRAGYGKWFVSLILAVLALLVGVLLIINPFSGATLIVMLIGIALILDGVTNIITAQTLKKEIGRDIEYFDID